MNRHKDPKTRAVCTSMKYMMLHVRDCPGTTSSYDICPFPWCRKTKHLLYHLVSCGAPDQCKICSPEHLTPQLKQLRGLNGFRRKKQKESGKVLPVVNSLPNKPSAKLSNPNHTKVQQNGAGGNAQQIKVGNSPKGKRNQGPNPIGQKLSQVNKRKPLSVPSPIPTVVTHQPSPSKTLGPTITKRHPGAPNATTKSMTKSGISRVQPNRNPLSIVAPANPLLSSQSELTPRTQNSTNPAIYISRPPQTANPLLKRPEVNSISTKDPLAKNSTSLSDSMKSGSCSVPEKNKANQYPNKASTSVTVATPNETFSAEAPSSGRVSKVNTEKISDLSQNPQKLSGANINPPKVSIPLLTIPKQEDNVTPSSTNNIATNSANNKKMTTSNGNSCVSNTGMQKTKSETMLEVGC